MGTHLALAVELKAVLGSENGCIVLSWDWLRLEAVGDVGEDLAGAEHAIGVESLSAVELVSVETR